MREFDEISTEEVCKLTKEQLALTGKKLKELRVVNGLTLNDVAFYTYGTISTIEKLELGKVKNVTLLTLIKLTTFYKVSLVDLLD